MPPVGKPPVPNWETMGNLCKSQFKLHVAQARGGGLKMVAHGKHKYFGGVGRCLSGFDKVIPLPCQSKVELPSGVPYEKHIALTVTQ